MNKLLTGALIALAASFGAYYFLVDGIIARQLEQRGSQALNLPLAIGDVTFRIYPTSLTLHEVRVGNAQVPTHDLVQAQTIYLPLSLRDLRAHKFIVDRIDVRGLRFNRARDGSAAPSAVSATDSPQLRAALQHVQQMRDHPLASNTIDPRASVAGAVLVDQFKPLLAQVTTALSALATAPTDAPSDWQILARRIELDGALDFGSNALRFVGHIDNVTPQPKLFDAVTQFDIRNADGEAGALRVRGSIDQRKFPQLTLRFDLDHFPLANWTLSADRELKIVVVEAKARAQGMLSLLGKQFDLNALAHFEQARFDIASGDSEIARTAAEVWRRAEIFDINLQAGGDVRDPVLRMNSSLDVPLAAALRQAQPPATSFSAP